MATKPKSRIRWTDEEVNAVVTAATELQARKAKLTSEQRVLKAQAVLPKHRRRPINANLASWLGKAVRGDLGEAGASSSAPGSPKAAKAPSGTTAAAMVPASITQALISAGVTILKGVLADAGVQRALRQALHK
jgi:hypothetical protein